MNEHARENSSEIAREVVIPITFGLLVLDEWIELKSPTMSSCLPSHRVLMGGASSNSEARFVSVRQWDFLQP